MKIFISPSEESKVIIEANFLRGIILSKWPDATINDVEDQNRPFVMEWNIQKGEEYLNGKLDRKEDMIVFEFSSIELAANFSVWIFSNLQSKNDIIMYNDSYSVVLPLSLTTTSFAIIDAFS